jgi:hypothetical protein
MYPKKWMQKTTVIEIYTSLYRLTNPDMIISNKRLFNHYGQETYLVTSNNVHIVLNEICQDEALNILERKNRKNHKYKLVVMVPSIKSSRINMSQNVNFNNLSTPRKNT